MIARGVRRLGNKQPGVGLSELMESIRLGDKRVDRWFEMPTVEVVVAQGRRADWRRRARPGHADASLQLAVIATPARRDRRQSAAGGSPVGRGGLQRPDAAATVRSPGSGVVNDGHSGHGRLFGWKDLGRGPGLGAAPGPSRLGPDDQLQPAHGQARHEADGPP
jgi:hypothetical protein